MATETPTRLYQSIHAQPEAIRSLLQDWDGPEQAAQQMAQAGRILLAGIGTSFHAATVGEYILRAAGAEAWAVRSFEFAQYPRPLHKDDAVIVISHRGNKQQGSLALQRAKEEKVPVVGITGKHSKMSGAAITLETVEQDPSSTHSISYTATLTRLAQIAIQLAKLNGEAQQAQRLEKGLSQIPTLMEHSLARETAVQKIAQEAVRQRRRLYFVGAGPNAITASEGALKTKEAAYVTAEGFELEQAIHGPLVAFEADDLLIPINVKGPAQTRMADLLLALNEIASRVWLIGDAPNEQTAALLQHEGWNSFPLSIETDFPEELTPLLTVVPVQLLANFLAGERGSDADAFRLDHEAYKRAMAHILL